MVPSGHYTSAVSGFFGSRPFSRANEYLVEHGKKPIDWLYLTTASVSCSILVAHRALMRDIRCVH